MRRFGHLTQEQIREVADAINAKTLENDERCVNCGSGPSVVIEMTGRVGFAYVSGKPDGAISTVATVCDNCGFVRQFAARKLGLSFMVWPGGSGLDGNDG